MSETMYGLSNNFKQVNTRYDPSHEVLWSFMNQRNMIPCFNTDIVRELTQHHEEIKKTGGVLSAENEIHRIRYSVAASLTPDVFNLGGQLTLIRDLAMNRQREALKNYGLQALNVLVQRALRFDLDDVITLSLIQGQALGAGFEAALASDYIIAEKKSFIGFPEILFNLFPGMGAYSLLARRAGNKVADEMILGGKVYTAEEALALGVIDEVAEDGEGENAIYNWIDKNKKKANGYLATQKAKNRVHPITEEELIDITMIWLEAALKLTERDFKMMARFVRSQEKMYLPAVAETTEAMTNVVALRTGTN
ncbi:MAG: crotonase/enoyl-CoA hydratase family protein [Methylophilaceae bacterium]